MKYLFCVSINENNHTTCCKQCYAIIHLDITIQQDPDKIVMCYSLMDQVSIVKKTMELYTKNKVVPSITEVDKDAQLLKLSPVEFCNIVRKVGSNDVIKNYKIFFKKIDQLEDSCEFSGDDENDELEPIEEPGQPVYHHFTKNELAFLQAHFNQGTK
jgi:hypothetical protein